MTDVIIIENLTKKFKETEVLSNINITFEKGKIHGLIGRNGSGKTMLMKCICGLVPVTSGTISINGKIVGKDIEIPENIGVIIENPGFIPSYSAYQNLFFLSKITSKIGKSEIRNSIQSVGLDPDNKKHVGKYSLGMRQRLGLDEPMNGLDKEGVADMRKYLLNLKEQGKTILLASHSAEDIEILCNTVCEMDKGRLTVVK